MPALASASDVNAGRHGGPGVLRQDVALVATALTRKLDSKVR